MVFVNGESNGVI